MSASVLTRSLASLSCTTAGGHMRPSRRVGLVSFSLNVSGYSEIGIEGPVR